MCERLVTVHLGLDMIEVALSSVYVDFAISRQCLIISASYSVYWRDEWQSLLMEPTCTVLLLETSRR